MVFVAAEEGEGDFRCYKEGGKRPQFRGGKEREGDGQGKMLAGILMRACGRHIDRRLAAQHTTHNEELATLCNIASGTNLYYPRGGDALKRRKTPFYGGASFYVRQYKKGM